MREIAKQSPKIPKPNRYERNLLKTDPKLAVEAYKARCVFAMAESYTGASRTRRSVSGWDVSSGDADTDILDSLDSLRTRCRDLERNNSIAGAAIATKTTSVVGTGLKLQARPNRKTLGLSDETADAIEDLIEAEFDLFGKSCDWEKTLNIYTLQELAFRSVLTSGDTLTLTPYRKDPGNAYGLKIQLVEADRIRNKDNDADSENIAGGVERENGVPVRFHVMKGHPGNIHTNQTEWMTINAWGGNGRRNAWLLYHKLRIGQYRGIPDLAPVIEDLKQFGRYKDAELMAAVVASLFTVFIKTPEGSGLSLNNLQDETGKNTGSDFKLGNGLILDLAEGEDVVTANPGRPNAAFENFVNAIITEIGARIELPRDVLLKSFTGSYSAARAALLEAWRYYRGRRKWLADNFCQPIYELFFTEAVASGRISAPGFLNGDPLIKQAWLGAEWVGDAPGHIDEGKAVKAAKERIDAGLSNEHIETTALTGHDRDMVYRGRKKEIEQRKADKMMPSDMELHAAAYKKEKNENP